MMILNKLDLILEKRIKGILKSLNPAAVILESTKSIVPLKAILNTKLFDMDKAIEAWGALLTNVVNFWCQIQILFHCLHCIPSAA